MEQQELQINEQPLDVLPSTDPLTQAMTVFLAALTKTLRNFDARIKALENNNE